MTGLRALVVGAGGIGAQVCRDFAAAGASVYFTFRQSQDAAVALSHELNQAPYAQLDAADPEATAKAVARVVEILGGIDVVVVTAGHRHELATFESTTPAGTDAVMAAELGAPMNVVRAVLPVMQSIGFGRVVLLGSDSGKTGSFGDAVSSAARGGLIAFAKSVARENAAGNITVNVVCPGPTDTELFADLAAVDGITGKVMNAIARSIPKKRLGTAQEVSAAVRFLASREASFITGQAVSVSGGLTM